MECLHKDFSKKPSEGRATANDSLARATGASAPACRICPLAGTGWHQAASTRRPIQDIKLRKRWKRTCMLLVACIMEYVSSVLRNRLIHCTERWPSQTFFDAAPFQGKNQYQKVVGFVTSGMRPERLEMPRIEDKTWNLIQECWKHKPSERLTMDAIVEKMTLPAWGWYRAPVIYDEESLLLQASGLLKFLKYTYPI